MPGELAGAQGRRGGAGRWGALSGPRTRVGGSSRTGVPVRGSGVGRDTAQHRPAGSDVGEGRLSPVAA
jgi:hypothetical protein